MENTVELVNIKKVLKDLKVSYLEMELCEYDDYICDAISEIADNNTSISYHDISKYISEHVEEVNEAIEELGWDGCGSDLYKAGQMAEYLEIERNFNIEDAVRYAVYKHLLENNIETITIDQDSEIDYIIEHADSNDRVSNILDDVDAVFETDEDEE